MQLVKEIKEPILTLLHFNDAYNIEPNSKGQLGFVNFFDLVQQKRQEYPQARLVFSGDCFAPSRLSRLFRGEQMKHCIKQLGIEVACLGNHDLDYPPQQVQQLTADCGFPWLLANIRHKHQQTLIGKAQPFFIFKTSTVKVGFIGLTGPDFMHKINRHYRQNYAYTDTKEQAQSLCRMLKQQEGCQLVVALTHCLSPIDKALATAVPGIDLILGGHDHRKQVQNVNRIPIVKSGSDFQYLTTVKVHPLSSNLNKKKGVLYLEGRRWLFEVQVTKVSKAQSPHLQLQNFIAKAISQYKQWNQSSALNNEQKLKKQQKKLPESNDLLEYGWLNNRPTVTLRAGLSAEICFAKYVAFKKGYFYLGHRPVLPVPVPGLLQHLFGLICDEIRGLGQHGDSVLYGPGLCSVPYMVETANLIYLPCQLLVGVNRVDALTAFIEAAVEQGYKCYAVLGYDSFFPKQLCAWIKFVQPPPQYLQLITDLKIKHILMMSVHDPKGQLSNGAQRNCRLIKGEVKQRKCPQVGDIYVNFVKEDNHTGFKKQLQIYGNLVKDRSEQFWRESAVGLKCQFMHDWQSGIDCIGTLKQSFQMHLKGRDISYHTIGHSDSWELYMTAYHLGKAFIELNYDQEHHPVKANGIVMNQYFMSNPSYELNYGWVPILYWQFYPQNAQRIMKVLTQQERHYPRWLNMHRGTHLRLVEKNSKVLYTDHEGKQLGTWITRHAPASFQLRYLKIGQIVEILKSLQLIAETQ